MDINDGYQGRFTSEFFVVLNDYGSCVAANGLTPTRTKPHADSHAAANTPTPPDSENAATKYSGSPRSVSPHQPSSRVHALAQTPQFVVTAQAAWPTPAFRVQLFSQA